MIRTLTIVIGLALAGCTQPSSPDAATDAAPSDVQGSALIGPAGGTIAITDVTLTIPPGALAAPQTITVTDLGDVVPAEYVGYSHVFRFEPAGIMFAQPVSVTFRFNGDATRAAVYWSNSAGTGFDRLASTIAGDRVSASTMHFSNAFVGDLRPRDGGIDASVDADGAVADVASDGATDAPTIDANLSGISCIVGRQSQGFPACSTAWSIEHDVRFWLVSYNGDPEGGINTNSAGIADLFLFSTTTRPYFTTTDIFHTRYVDPPSSFGSSISRNGDVVTIMLDAARGGDPACTSPGIAVRCSGSTTLSPGPLPPVDASAYDAADVPTDTPAEAASDAAPVDAGTVALVPLCTGVGTMADELPESSATDSAGNVYTAGMWSAGSTSQVFLEKFDPSCHLAWRRLYGTGSQGSPRIATDPSGNVLFAVSNRSGSSVMFDNGATETGNVVIAMIRPDATTVWTHSYAGQYASIRSVASDPSGNMILAGDFTGTLTLGGASWTAPMLIMTGHPSEIELFVAKYDPLGRHLWSRAINAPPTGDMNYLGGLATTPGGDILLTGEMHGSIDFGNGRLTTFQSYTIFVARISGATGAGIWSRMFESANSGNSNGIPYGRIGSDGAGNAIVTGYTQYGGASFVTGGMAPPGSWLLDLTAAGGAHSWHRVFDSAPDYPPTVTVDSAGNNLNLVWVPPGGVDFGAGVEGTAPSGTPARLGLALFDSTGHHVWSNVFSGTEPGVGIPSTGPAGTFSLSGAVCDPVNFGLGPIMGPAGCSNAAAAGRPGYSYVARFAMRAH